MYIHVYTCIDYYTLLLACRSTNYGSSFTNINNLVDDSVLYHTFSSSSFNRDLVCIHVYSVQLSSVVPIMIHVSNSNSEFVKK